MVSEHGILITKQMYREPLLDMQFVQAMRGKILRCKIDARDVMQMPAELERQMAAFRDPDRTGELPSIIEQTWL